MVAASGLAIGLSLSVVLLFTAPAAIAHALTDGFNINDFGGVGLLQLPTARVAPEGWATLGASIAHPYRHGFLSFQPTRRLETTLRVTGDDGPPAPGQPLFTAGLDIKVVLAREGRWRPQIAVGARNLLGDRLFSGEYLAFSKRWAAFDVMLGVGWGRFAGGGLVANPFRLLAGHFGRDRPLTGDGGGLEHLFTGESLGLFGGVQVRLPWSLGLMIELTPDDLAAERRRDPDLRRALPVNAGLSWRPWPWLDAGLGIEQGSRIMARLSSSFDPGALPGRPRPLPPAPIVPRAAAAPGSDAAAVLAELRRAGFDAEAIAMAGARLDVRVEADPRLPVATLIGRVARVLTLAAPPRILQFGITVAVRGLDTATVTLMRRDLERAGRHAGSPAEIGRTAAVGRPAARRPEASRGVAPRLAVWGELRSELSLFESEQAAMSRLSLLGEAELRPWPGLVLGVGGRLNLADDLTPADPARGIADPVRSDAFSFARAAPLRLERAYAARLGRPAEDVSARVALGWFEEAYAGVNAELLWRPFTARYAVGAELGRVWRRDPDSQIQVLPSAVTTGHLDLYYRPAVADFDARLSVGRYLAGDWGGTVELARMFDNGVRIGAFATLTDRSEGRSGRVDGGFRVAIPLQALPGVPPRSTASFAVAPLLRDAGQRLRSPLRLYDLTGPAGHGAITQGWPRLLD